ncbi:hypothetical protein [Meiothermus granaticius]|uniref:CopG family transcriptional regulator n=1 Tax=Meiothermus granaticius NBRC 107808 TaxID=1227551 RepID=A0A399FBL6_9DEIN|nr:hypothetical protein [Meiothermus granaticius]MCL6527552.1 hypothetical protein [Thermaceae bacterium]RIH93543.1 hypothetical protein Mgrana_00597 [Meiothermus granaticius NBRC 107808]GEM86039.1 hypothetical protein MGR01S_06640 [Meiothermus granaticius NBRC 107808]
MATSAEKVKVTLTLDPEVVRAYRLAAARKGLRDNQVVEEALRAQLGVGALEALLKTAPKMDETEAVQAANEELRAYRKIRRKTKR